MRALIYRYKLLKIAEMHGSDTVKEYADSDIADNNTEDATKLRSVVARSATEKRQNQTPYSRNQPSITQRKTGVFDCMSTMKLFLDSQSGFR